MQHLIPKMLDPVKNQLLLILLLYLMDQMVGLHLIIQYHQDKQQLQI